MASLDDRAIAQTKKLLALIDITPTDVTASQGDDQQLVVDIAVNDEDSGLLIGYHGETLVALQYLVGQLVNKGQEEWRRILININGYRDRRETQLKEMAKNAAERALLSGDEIEMPYLTPAERRIMHLELSQRSDVTTFSEGDGRNRRLIVAPATAAAKASAPKEKPENNS